MKTIDVKEHRCGKCGKVLFETIPLDADGRRAVNPYANHTPLESEKGDYFYRCPSCTSKNVVKSFKDNEIEIASLR